MAHSTWFAQFVKNSYFAVFGQQDSKSPKKPCSGAEWPTRLNSLSFWERIISLYLARKNPSSPKTGFSCRMAHLTWFAQFVKNSYFAVFGQQDSKSLKKPCSGAEWPTRLNSLSFWEWIISPHLARKTTKTLKSRVQKLNAPFGLIRPVCEKKLFRHNWPKDSDKQKQPCSCAKWPIRLVWPSLWERGNSPHLVRKTTKSAKSRVEVSEWPIRLDSPSLWERFFRRIWRGRLRKDQKAIFKRTMPPSTWFVQFVRKNYYPVLRQQNSENPKSRIEMQNGPLDLICPVCRIWPARLRKIQLWET